MKIDEIQSTAVIGLGTMGHGIAQTFAAGGYTVRAFDDHPAARASAKDRIRTNLMAFVNADLLPSDQVEPILSRITICETETDTIVDAQFITEVVKEDLAVKQELFARLETLVPPTTILASNSSTFPISQSGNRLRHPERAVVTHWFNPPHLVPLVEVVPGPKTSAQVTQTAVELMARIGKQPLWLRKELPGFLINRIQVAVMREVWDLLDQGVASPEEIDAAVSGSIGFRLAAQGLLEVQDFGGLDIQTTIFKLLTPELRSDTVIPAVVRKLVDQGHYGPKTGKGFHDYPPDRLASRQARRDRMFLALKKLLDESS